MTTREYPTRPIVGLGVVIVGPKGVVLIKRGKPPRVGAWSLPGGAQKVGETVNQGLKREAEEETGLHINLIEIIDVVDSITRDDDGHVQFHYTLVDAVGVVTGGELAAGSDAADARWFSRTELPALRLWKETDRIIQRAFEIYEGSEGESIVP